MIFTCILDHEYELLPTDSSDTCRCGFPGWMHEREWRTSILGRLKPCKTCSAPTVGRVKQDAMCHACWVGGTVDFDSGAPLESKA